MNSSRYQGVQKRPFSHQIGDRRLIPRIEQYVTQGCRGRVPDGDEIADYLCMMYPEYRRKKRNWFVASVLKALGIIQRKSANEDTRLNSLGQQHLATNMPILGGYVGEKEVANDISSSESDVEILEPGNPLVEVKDTNSINRSIHEIYSRNKVEKQGNTSTPNKLRSSASISSKRLDTSFGAPALDTKNTTGTSKEHNKKDDSLGLSIVNGKHEGGEVVIECAKNSDIKGKHPDTFIEIIDVPASPSDSKAQDSSSSERPKSNKKIEAKEKVPKRKALKRKADENIEEAETDESLVKSSVTFRDIGGCEGCLQEISKLILHMKHPEVFHQLGVHPPRGFLLHGPPGCGKTLLANAIAGELGLPFYKVAATEMVSGVSGESEEKIRNLFNEAKTHAPSILFFDEIDAITPKRETAAREMERRIVSQLLFCLDDLVNSEAHVLVIGATNRPDSLDPALRRAGRFDREICMGIPDRNARARILEIECKTLRLAEDFSYDEIASLTPGFVGADLMALAREAAMCAVDRVFKEVNSIPKSSSETAKPEKEENKMETDETNSDNKVDDANSDNKVDDTNLDNKVDDTSSENKGDAIEESLQPSSSGDDIWQKMKDELPLTKEQLANMFIEMEDFKAALSLVQPSAKREGFATIPDVSWDDIGALEDVKEELSMAVLAPVKNQKEFDALGLTTPPGILLAGPPGCGKTLVAKAVANEAGINFISVKGPELLNMYVGESERAVRQVFQRARNSSPCVIFFDEIDALCPKRSDMAESSASSRVVNQLLTEMDGLEVRKQVYLMGATNRPDIIDPAILRPGRLDKKLYIGLPSEEDRQKILLKITKDGTKPKLSDNVDLEAIAGDSRCKGFSGADLAALVREASTHTLREYFKSSNGKGKTELFVTSADFEAAFAKVKPSVLPKDNKWYERILNE